MENRKAEILKHHCYPSTALLSCWFNLLGGWMGAKAESEQGKLKFKQFLFFFFFSVAIPGRTCACQWVIQSWELCLHLSWDNITQHPLSWSYHILPHPSGVLSVPSVFSCISLGWSNVKFYSDFFPASFPFTLIKCLSLVDREQFYWS